MKVVLARLALADLDEIANWIARDSLERGERFIDQLQRRCAALSSKPARFPVVYNGARGEIRKLTYRGYLILYRIRDDRIDVLRVVHGSRDWAALISES